MPLRAAAETAPVSLELVNCSRLDEASVRRIFAADLGTRIANEPNPHITDVNIRCQGARVIVEVRDPLSRKTVQRSFDSTSFGDRGEARLVAIAASELVMASWAELAANPAPEVEPEGPTPPAQTLETARAVVRAHRGPVKNLDSATPSAREAPPSAGPPGSPENTPQSGTDGDASSPYIPAERKRPPAPPDPSRVGTPVLRIMAIGSMRAFFNGSGELWGGGARIGEERFTVASWAVDALVESGTLASTKVTSATIGGLLHAFYAVEPLTLRAGVGLRAGLVTSENGSYLGTLGWPLATTSVSLFAHHLVFDLSGELGHGVLPLSSGAEPSVRGFWGSAQLGVGLWL
ncbi:MAG TPA: hypothetical protein VGK73_27655 [Polyangiaceae bacterium]